MKKLLHTTKEFSLEQIKKHLWIEEETRIHVKKFTIESGKKVNYVEENKNVQKKRKFSEAAKNFKNPGNPNSSKK